MQLVQMDTHRAGNSAADMVERALEHNERVDARGTRDAADATAGALERFYFEAGKTLGVTKTDFYT